MADLLSNGLMIGRNEMKGGFWDQVYVRENISSVDNIHHPLMVSRRRSRLYVNSYASGPPVLQKLPGVSH
jgi:hypothetical protein